MKSHKVLVLYYSRQGSTHALAQCVANGVESVNTGEAVMRTVPSVSSVCEASEPEIPKSGDIYAQPADFENCVGLVLGSPTRFGTIASPLKYFFDQCTPQWISGALTGKPGAVFTSSSSMHGGQESTLLGMLLPLLHHGMLITGIPYYQTKLGYTQRGGTPYGASHVASDESKPTLGQEEKEFAELLGRRVTEIAVKLN